MSEGGTGTPHYVINPDHVIRLLYEGYQIVPDPRVPVGEAVEINEEELEKLEDDDSTRRLATAKPANKTRTRSVDTAQ